MFYIHQTSCISAQETFGIINIDAVNKGNNNKMLVIEPTYIGIPPGILRRMGKAVRIGVGAALPLIQNNAADGIIIGTANGGMEDCIKFLNQIIEYEEGQLTPTNFVQSTPNAIAAQLGLLKGNKGYNITHVHRGCCFENAVIDAVMKLNENPGHQYLLGAVDEISSYNYNIENLAGWYKKELVDPSELYNSGSQGTIAGEGAAMFVVNSNQLNAIAKLEGIKMLHTTNENNVLKALQEFVTAHLPANEKIDVFLSGENGDIRLQKYVDLTETVVDKNVGIARFKHMLGEFTSATALATWLACEIFTTQHVPGHMWKRAASKESYQRILLYNNYKGLQHSFMLFKKAG